MFFTQCATAPPQSSPIPYYIQESLSQILRLACKLHLRNIDLNLQCFVLTLTARVSTFTEFLTSIILYLKRDKIFGNNQQVFSIYIQRKMLVVPICFTSKIIDVRSSTLHEECRWKKNMMKIARNLSLALFHIVVLTLQKL